MMKAGALFTAVIVSLLIALICSSFILFAYISGIQLESSRNRQRAERNAASGMQLLLVNDERDLHHRNENIDLFNEGKDSVELSILPWGAYDLFKSSARCGKFHFEKIALSGYAFYSTIETALYLQDLNTPLSIIGNTFIKGICYLPKAGVRVAYIENTGYGNDQLIYGETKQSDYLLPKINEELIDQMREFSEGNITISLDITNTELSRNIHQSFNAKTKVIYSDGIINLTSGSYSGNIHFRSSKGIHISNHVILKDIIVSAPFVIINDEFTGSLQAFAVDSMKIGEQVKLEYPSVLGIIQTEPKLYNTFIEIGKKSVVEGVVFGYTFNSPVHNRFKISLLKESVISGELYSNSMIDIQGSVFGSVSCAKFTLKTPSSVYENHLMDATIDYSRLNNDFVSVSLINQTGRKKIVKWLY